MVSLKAELLRKQEEVNKAKQHAINPTVNYIPKHSSDSSSNRLLAASKKPSYKTLRDSNKPPPEDDDKSSKNEDNELLAKSRRVLEAKAKLYERMSAGGGSLNSEDTCLVMFNEKKQMAKADNRHLQSSSSESSDANDDDDDETDDPNNEWTEYTDCLGRTRKCLKKDLEFFKKRDSELAKVATERQRENERDDELIGPPVPSSMSQTWYVDTKGVDGITSKDLPLNKPENMENDDNFSMISSKFEEMRSQWEEKERENMNRDQIHYQDVLFDEARTHGVGYYGFSIDEKERAKQQQQFEAERVRTREAQQQREQQRQTREQIIAERVLAAKNRQRARLGLPPLTKEDEEKEKGTKQEEPLFDDKDLRKQKKKEEKEKKKKEKIEREREEERKQHIRPWDKPKIATHQVNKPISDSEEEWQYKPEQRGPMSQEEWNELKRDERIKEFAPPVVPEPIYEEEPKESFNRFTTIKKKPFKRRNMETTESATSQNSLNIPIKNELSDNEEEEERDKRRRTEIAPPLTFEYFGPSSTASKPQRYPKKTSEELESSIAAGLLFLREQSDKTATTTKQTWTAKADY